jgi:hypothetical protein
MTTTIWQITAKRLKINKGESVPDGPRSFMPNADNGGYIVQPPLSKNLKNATNPVISTVIVKPQKSTITKLVWVLNSLRLVLK